MHKTRKALVIFLALMMVLSQGGAVLSYFDYTNLGGAAYAETADTSTQNDQDENDGAKVQETTSDENAEQVDESAEAVAAEEDVLEGRTLKVTPEREKYYSTDSNGKKHWSDPVKLTEVFWYSLTGRRASLQKNGEKKPLTLVVKGNLPKGVTAEAKYIEFNEEKQHEACKESALFAIELRLLDRDGNNYVPEEPVLVSLASDSIKDSVKGGDSFTIYSYEENIDRSEKFAKKYGEDIYTADVLVYRDTEFDKAAAKDGKELAAEYEPYDKDKNYKKGEDAVRYYEEADGLAVTNKDEIEFNYLYGYPADLKADADDRVDAAYFVLSALKQEEAKEEVKQEESKQEEQKQEEAKKEETQTVTKAGKITASDKKTYSVKVSYEASAGIPEDAELQVEEISSDDSSYKAYVDATAEKLDVSKKDITLARAFDIKIVDKKTGEEYQPETDVKVSIELLDEELNKDSEISVVHFEDSNNKKITADQTEVMDSSVKKDGAVEFSTDGFSVYVIIEHEGDTDVKTPRVEFHFLDKEFSDLGDGEYAADLFNFVNKGGTTQSSQIVKNGESLEQIQNPSNYKDSEDIEKYFFGWYVVSDAVPTTDDPNRIRYSWTEDPQKLAFENEVTITGGESIGSDLTWKIDSGSDTIEGTASVDSEGTAHVYLAPLYRSYKFVNMHSASLADDQKESITSRRLVVLGSDNEALVNIGLQVESRDSAHKVFAGWEKSDHTVFHSVDPVTKEEVTKTVYATYGEDPQHPYPNPKPSGYYIAVRPQDFKMGETDIDSLDLYPVYAEARWIYFSVGREQNNGATYVPAEYLLTSDDIPDTYYTEKLPAGSIPLRNGYIFKGWYDAPVSDNDPGSAKQLTDEEGKFTKTGSYYKKEDDQGRLLYEIKGGKLYLYSALEELQLYALWEEQINTTVQVNVWKQKVTDSKDAADSEKKYDYDRDYSYQAAASSAWDLEDARDNGVLKKNGTIDVENLSLTGFHYKSTSMSTRKISGDGTTVIDVRYDRDLRAINFYFANNITPPTTSYDAYLYSVTTSSTGTQYGIVDGQYVELVNDNGVWRAPGNGWRYELDNENGNFGKVDDEYYELTPVYDDKWKYSTKYTYEPSSASTGTTYGLVDGEYVQLERRVVSYNYRYNTAYQQTNSVPSSNQAYGIYGGEFVVIYYKGDGRDKGWYRTVESDGGCSGATYSNPYSGSVFNQIDASGTYTGTRYKISGNSMVATADETGNLYGRSGSGNYTYYELNAEAVYGYFVNNQAYDGQRYTRSEGASYTGERLARSGSSAPYTYTPTTEDGHDLFMQDSNQGADGRFGHVELIGSSSEDVSYYTYTDGGGDVREYPTTADRYSWKYGPVGVEYNLTRFTRDARQNNYRMITWTGLYGQTFAQNGYSWDTVSRWVWREGASSGTYQTMLDAFTQPENPYTLFSQGNNGNNAINHYRQQLDGTYTQDDKVTAYTSNSSSNFSFSNKFDGYTVYTYSTKNEGFVPQGGTHDASDGTSATLDTPFYVYHKRNDYTLKFSSNYPNVAGLEYSNGRKEEKDETVLFDAPLSAYGKDETGQWYWTPPGPDHYTFQGWYEDASGTKAFDFNSNMPSGSIILYGKWRADRFTIQIDPNGGEIDHVNHNWDNENPDKSKQGYSNYWWNENGDAVPYKASQYNDQWRPFATFNRENDSGYRTDQSTYINGTYNGIVNEYALTREYVEITDAEAESIGDDNWYYYLNTQWQPTDGNPGLPSDLRNALYIKKSEVDEYYDFYVDWVNGNLQGGYISGTTILGKNNWMDTYLTKDALGGFQKYRKLHSNESYSFLGWYKIDENGNKGDMPYNFSDPIKGPLKLRAEWKLEGGYTIEYIPSFTMSDGTKINGEMSDWIDPERDPDWQPGEPFPTYADNAKTNIYIQPTGITADGSESAGENYMFRGWRLVSKKTTIVDGTARVTYVPLENNVFYDPGDEFTIKAGYANDAGTIYFQAVYEHKGNAYRRPDVAALTLDANSGYITTDGENPLEGKENLSWDDNGVIQLDGDNERAVFGYYADKNQHFQTGRPIHLYKYSTELEQDNKGNDLDPAGVNYFKHNNGYTLIGFDDEPDEGDYIASYPADSVISLQRKDNDIKYAVWEPMVYLNIVNSTKNPEYNSDGGPVTFSLRSADNTTLYVVNAATGTYERTALDNLGDITVEEGETLRLVIPYGATKDITISGVNQLGTGIILGWQGELDGVTDGHPDGEANNGSNFSISDTLVEDPNGITVTFTSKKADKTLVLDENYAGGHKPEVYFSNKISDNNYVEDPYTLTQPGTRVGFEFIGWAETKAKADAGNPDYDINHLTIDNMKTRIFDRLDNDEDDIVTLYAVWHAKAEANTVYIYKVVPDPGDKNKQFTFNLNCTASYKPYNKSETQKSFNASYNIGNNQYLKLVTEQDARGGQGNPSAYITTSVEKWEIIITTDEEGHETSTERMVESYPVNKIEWSNYNNKEGGWGPFAMNVEEANYENDYYDTDFEIVAQATEHLLSKSSVRKLSWDYAAAGGSVIFTNTRQTVDVPVKKELIGTNMPRAFNYEASYVYDGNKRVDVEDFNVTSGSQTGNIIEKVPVGANLTVTEKGTDLLSYITSARKSGETAADPDVDLEVSKSSSTEGGVTTYKRTVSTVITKPPTDNDKRIITFTNELKSAPIKIFKIGFDGTNKYTDVEALFNLSTDTSSVFTGRATRPTSLDERGNIVFETGKVFGSNTSKDPKLYVGDYTLAETKVYGDYIKLDDSVTIRVIGTDDDDGNGVKVEAIGNGASTPIRITGSEDNPWVIRIVNRKTAKIRVRKGLLDPMIQQRSFVFGGSYKLNGVTYNLDGEPVESSEVTDYSLDTFELTAIATSDGSVDSSQAPKELTIPIGAKNVRIYENTDISAGGGSNETIARTYDTYVSYNSTDTRTKTNEYVYNKFTANNANDVITFFNNKKTIDVKVKKIVSSANTDGSFNFNATLLNGANEIKGYPIDLNGTPLDTSDDQKTSETNGSYGFTLANDGSKILTIPVGSKLKISETGVSGNNQGDSLDTYSTTAEAVYTDRSPSTAYTNTTSYDEESRLFTFTAPGENITVTYTNGDGKFRDVMLRKTNSSYEPPKSSKSFTIYKGNSIVKIKQEDGSFFELKNLPSGDDGVFYAGKLAYGDYVIKESDPERYFFLIVDEDGVICSENGISRDTKKGGYDSMEAAQEALNTAKSD